MKKVENSKIKITSIIIAALLIVIIGLIIFIIVNGNKKDNTKKKKVDHSNTTNRLLDIEATTDEYEVLNANADPIYQNISINGKDVDYHASYYSVMVDKVYKVKDTYLVAILALYKDSSTTYDTILYAIDKNGNVLWYTSEKSICESNNSSLCYGLVGQSTTSEFGYVDRSYDIKENVITFATRIPGHNINVALCNMNADDTFAVEYEIKYNGKGKYSSLKEKTKLTAGEYLKNLSDGGSPVDCSEYKY